MKGCFALKKIVLILVVFFAFSISIVSAEIKTTNDEFSGSMVLQSEQEVLAGVITLQKDKNDCELLFWTLSKRGERFSKAPILIKIDNDPDRELAVSEEVFRHISKVVKAITVKIKLPQKTIDEIKNSNRVALKIFKDQGDPSIIVLTDDILAEWKQVINTTE